MPTKRVKEESCFGKNNPKHYNAISSEQADVAIHN